MKYESKRFISNGRLLIYNKNNWDNRIIEPLLIEVYIPLMWPDLVCLWEKPIKEFISFIKSSSSLW